MEPRKTRSNCIFSPWEFYHVGEPFDFEKAVQETVQKSLEEEFHGQNLAEDAIFSTSPLSSPDSTPPGLPVQCTAPRTLEPSIPPTPSAFGLAALPSKFPDQSPDLATDRERLKLRRKARSRASRKKKREEVQQAFGHYNVRKRISKRFVEEGMELPCSMDFEDAEVTSTGFTAKREERRSRRVYRLDELVGEGSKFNFQLLRWDGQKTIALVGKQKKIIAVLAGHPNDHDWPDVARDAADALESRRHRCSTPVSQETKKNHRGAFTALRCGVSHGGGQTHPMNLKNDDDTTRVLEELNKLKCFQRIAGFSSGVMATRAPRLFEYYASHIRRLYQNDPSLQHLFSASIFCATTYNLGPRTVCYPHRDIANLPFGWCSITALGQFNPKLGGHIVLWECGLVIEFPPGSTILIPSAIVTHSNTAIQPSETRYSFTQYTAGAIFRWVQNNFQTAIDFRNSLSPEALALEEDKDRNRWKEGVKLLPDEKKPPPSLRKK